MKEIPNKGYKCNFCSEPAIYDAPTEFGGRWAHMCEKCFQEHKCNTSEIGFKFVNPVAPVAKTNSDQTVQGIEDTSDEYYENILMDIDMRSVECPLCHNKRTLEVDASEYICECGAKVLAVFI